MGDIEDDLARLGDLCATDPEGVEMPGPKGWSHGWKYEGGPGLPPAMGGKPLTRDGSTQKLDGGFSTDHGDGVESFTWQKPDGSTVHIGSARKVKGGFEIQQTSAVAPGSSTAPRTLKFRNRQQAHDYLITPHLPHYAGPEKGKVIGEAPGRPRVDPRQIADELSRKTINEKNLAAYSDEDLRAAAGIMHAASPGFSRKGTRIGEIVHQRGMTEHGVHSKRANEVADMFHGKGTVQRGSMLTDAELLAGADVLQGRDAQGVRSAAAMRRYVADRNRAKAAQDAQRAAARPDPGPQGLAALRAARKR